MEYFGQRVVEGDVPGYSSVTKFGNNLDIDIISGFEAIWNGGGDYTGHDPVAAETIEVFSSDVNDDAAGTGARTIEIFGLDGDGVEINETITLDGTTAVDSVNTYLRMYRAIVRTAGSGGVNAGTLTARQKTTTANIFMVMPIGYNQTMIACYTVPAGKTGYIIGMYAGLVGGVQANSNIRLMARPNGEVFQVKEESSISAAGSSYITRKYSIPKGPFAALTDIKVMADSDSNSTGISAGFDMIIVDNKGS